MSLIGRKVKGFRFTKCGVIWNPEMENYIDKEGVLIEQYKDYCLIRFTDYSWAYPAELIEQHLID